MTPELVESIARAICTANANRVYHPPLGAETLKAVVDREWVQWKAAAQAALSAIEAAGVKLTTPVDLKGYRVMIGKDEDYWAAYAPECPGCIAVGDTPDEALREMQDALEGWLEAVPNTGLPTPQPVDIGPPNWTYQKRAMIAAKGE